MQDNAQNSVRKELIGLLESGNGQAAFDTVVKGIAPEYRGAKPAGSPHTIWQLLEHLRIAQSDLLEFSRDPQHKSPAFPDGYWPRTDGPANEGAWEESIARFRVDLAAFAALVGDETLDLTAPMPHAPDGQSLLREALTLADHNSYHLGQIAVIRKMLGDWK